MMGASWILVYDPDLCRLTDQFIMDDLTLTFTADSRKREPAGLSKEEIEVLIRKTFECDGGGHEERKASRLKKTREPNSMTSAT